MASPTNLLLTGKPGVGKTTLVCKLLGELNDRNVMGFYTQEVRKRGARTGFEAIAVDGSRMRLADVSFSGRPRVGKYGVDVEGFEEFLEMALPAPEEQSADCVILDEIGKMECFSPLFVDRTRKWLAASTPVVATIAQRGSGFIADVKKRSDGELLTIDETNRNDLLAELTERLRTRLA